MALNLEDYIASIRDFPTKGILFRDVTPLIADGEAFREATWRFADFAKETGADVIVGPESRGFIFGAPVATELGIGFVPVRKPGKLPRETISCKYDLEYDSVLNSLKDKSTVIEIGELAEEEVTIALNKLENGLGKKIDRVTAKMLRTVQMLDSFSLLFRRNKSKINFNNHIELYDALWDTVICDSSPRSDVEMREHLMYKIVETIQIAGTLNPQFTPDSSQKRAYEYLASNGLIRREGSAVSFFHL